MFERIDDERIQFRNVEQLTDDMRHSVNVLPQSLSHFLVFQNIQPGSQDAQGRAQFVRSIRGEIALNPKTFFKPVQRLVDCRHEGTYLARNLFGRQTQAGMRRSDVAGDLRGLPQGSQGTTEDGDIRDQQH